MTGREEINAHRIIFGMNREEDERSLRDFLQLFCDPRLTSVLIPRMTDEEIQQTVAQLSTIMRNHLNEKEYHTLFMGQSSI